MKIFILNIQFLILFVSCSQGQAKLTNVDVPSTSTQISKTDAEWKQVLTEEEYQVLRKKATERPFTGGYNKLYDEGVYLCKGCKNPLFNSETKFDSGTGWPSFNNCIPDNVKDVVDNSHGMERVEVVCGKCNGHLGHVFNDGPKPTGLRYCINSISLEFEGE